MKTVKKIACILTAICGIILTILSIILLIIPGLAIGETLLLIIGISTTVASLCSKNLK